MLVVKSTGIGVGVGLMGRRRNQHYSPIVRGLRLNQLSLSSIRGIAAPRDIRRCAQTGAARRGS